MQGRRITARIRKDLKKPLGEIIGKRMLAERLGEKSGRIVSVGDITTITLLDCGILPDVAFVDYICRREKITKEERGKLDAFKAREILVKNPAGMVSRELWEACRQVLSPKQKYPIKVVVEGEEDLAVIPAIIHSPNNSSILYGQPSEGIVLIIVDDFQKERAKAFYNDSDVIK